MADILSDDNKNVKLSVEHGPIKKAIISFLPNTIQKAILSFESTSNMTGDIENIDSNQIQKAILSVEPNAIGDNIEHIDSEKINIPVDNFEHNDSKKINIPDNFEHNDIVTQNYYTLDEYPSLPLDGWIKPCSNCGIQTSRFVIINTDKYYMCELCIIQQKYLLLHRYYSKINRFIIDS